MAAIGFIVVGIPGAAIWVLCCLILAIVQIGTLPVAIPVIIWAWSAESTLSATLFTIWMVIVSISDNVLKPILLGKGAPVPMLVVFLGAIGGFILSGFIGLFTGAVVLSLGYKLFEVWLNESRA
jgi:predicted PurR-regulated permease PerM